MRLRRSPLSLSVVLLLGTACGTTSAPGPEGSAQAKDAPTATAEPSDAEALSTALDDEYKAEAMYAAVLEVFPGARPFANIIEAEKRHSGFVKTEMDRLGIRYETNNPYDGKLEAPATLLAACEAGVKAELENIALYDRLLPTVSDAQVRTVLERLQAASQDRHLPAFERCVERGGAPGGGRGRSTPR